MRSNLDTKKTVNLSHTISKDYKFLKETKSNNYKRILTSTKKISKIINKKLEGTPIKTSNQEKIIK
jgi:hypothetical protein